MFNVIFDVSGAAPPPPVSSAAAPPPPINTSQPPPPALPTSQPQTNGTAKAEATAAGTSQGGNNSGRSTPNSGDPSAAKLFVGGLSWQTSSDKLRQYFGMFGTVTDVLIMKDPITQVNIRFISAPSGKIFRQSALLAAKCLVNHNLVEFQFLHSYRGLQLHCRIFFSAVSVF